MHAKINMFDIDYIVVCCGDQLISNFCGYGTRRMILCQLFKIGRFSKVKTMMNKNYGVWVFKTSQEWFKKVIEKQ